MYYVYYTQSDTDYSLVFRGLVSAGNKAQAAYIHKKWAKSVGLKIKIKDVVFTRDTAWGAI